ncbi:hypothetical protein P4B09_14630 [Lactiplantibacillus plantarum]
MLFLAIMGLIVFLLALFSVIYARQTGGGWKFLTLITIPQRPGHHLRGR